MPDNTSESTDIDQSNDVAEHLPIIGWREWISFPDFPLDWVKVKVDTGARSSSIHVESCESFERDGTEWIRFAVVPWQGSKVDEVVVEAPVVERREVRSSSGDSQERAVVACTIGIAGGQHTIELTLTDRDQMGFRMLLGREAVRGRFLVDPGRSYLTGRAPRSIRKINRQGNQ